MGDYRYIGLTTKIDIQDRLKEHKSAQEGTMFDFYGKHPELKASTTIDLVCAFPCFSLEELTACETMHIAIYRETFGCDKVLNQRQAKDTTVQKKEKNQKRVETVVKAQQDRKMVPLKPKWDLLNCRVAVRKKQNGKAVVEKYFKWGGSATYKTGQEAWKASEEWIADYMQKNNPEW
jgi:hypothetical protein